MKKTASFLFLAVGLLFGTAELSQGSNQSAQPDQQIRRIADSFENRKSGVEVSGEGVVVQILPDDNEGGKHQRFIIKLPGNQTILIAHNIDIAPRIDSIKPGDTIAFKGIYEWNSKGGVVHWTHRDPGGKHPGGWVKKGTETYQ